MRYTFESPSLNYDGIHLFIKLHDRILKFTNIGDFDIRGTKLSFYGDYIPNKYEIISFKLKNNPNEYLGRFIEFTHDRTGIKVDFSFDKVVQSPHIKPICYSDVEIVTFTKIGDSVIYYNVWKSMDYIYDKKSNIIRKDLWIPKEGDTYWFICESLDIIEATYNPIHDSCREHINVFNCFKTEQEAETIRDKFLKLLLER